MTSPAAPMQWLDLDWSGFDPWRVKRVRHRLCDHPLLQPDRLTAFARRHEQRGRVRSHGIDARAGTSFDDAPTLHPNHRPAADTLADLAQAAIWMSLLHIQTDDEYRGLVDAVIEDLRPGVERRDPGLHSLGGWVFVSSPRAVTPFHMDREHNFILQISGRKTLYVWEPDDTVAVSEAARDHFLANDSRALVVWREELRQRAHVVHLEPGDGAYMPSTSPHMVENGPDPSITASFTYVTEATCRHARLHTLHQRLRERGWSMPPVGAQPRVDALACVAFNAYGGLKSLRRRLGGQAAETDRPRYAPCHIA